MKKFIILGVLVLSLLVIGISFLSGPKQRPTDWSDGFWKEQKKPFGTYVLYQTLKESLPERHFLTEREGSYTFFYHYIDSLNQEHPEILDSLYKHWLQFDDTCKYYGQYDWNKGSDSLFLRYERETADYTKYYPRYFTAKEKHNVFLLTNNYTPDTQEVANLAQYVLVGNDVFICASTYSKLFLESFDISEPSYEWNLNQLEEKERQQIQDSLTQQLLFTSDPERNYHLARASHRSFFRKWNVSRYEVMGTRNKGYPEYVRLRWGLGNLYIHLNPYAFGNYSLLRPEGLDYVKNALAPLQVKKNSPDYWVWLDGRGNYQMTGDPLSYIMSQPALKWAFWLLLCGAVVYVFVMGKRRQRVIPMLTRPRNETLEFVNIMSKFYYNAGAHRQVAMKKIDYFLDTVRQQYFIPTQDLDQAFCERLASKTGAPLIKVRELVNMILQIRAGQIPEEQDLVALQQAMEAVMKVEVR